MEKDESNLATGTTPDLLLPRCWFLPACFLLIIAMDFFFYQETFGWTAALYAALLAAVCLPGKPELFKTRPLITASIFLLAAIGGLLIDPDLLSCMLALLALVLFRMIIKTGWLADFDWWLPRLIHFGLYGWGQWALDARHIGANGHSIQKRIMRTLLFWIIPLILSLIFIALFAAANPLIEQWGSRFIEKLSNIDFPAPERFMLWLLIACWVWALLRMTLGQERTAGDAATSFSLQKILAREFKPVMPPPGRWNYNAAPVVMRCLILFNIIFMVQNLLDVEYLWGGMGLPSGMTYAAYAHRGAYPLIATALLAGCFVLICFAGNTDAGEWRWPRILVTVWLGQNIFLVMSAILRLVKYVNIYSLSELRVAAAIWMALVAAGLLLILFRLLLHKSNKWLINANLVVLLAVLLGCCYTDIRGFIANYNVRHCRETAPDAEAGQTRAPLDVKYLRELGVPALPALQFLHRNYANKFGSENNNVSALDRNRLRVPDAAALSMLDQIAKHEQELKAQLKDELSNWRGWTWRRHCIARQIEE